MIVTPERINLKEENDTYANKVLCDRKKQLLNAIRPSPMTGNGLCQSRGM